MDDTLLSGPRTRVRVRLLSPNAVRVTHAPAEANAFPPDRPWLKDVLLPQPEPDSALMHVELVDGLVRASDRDGNEFFREADPPRLGIRRHIPFLSLEITKTELRAGLRRVEAGVRLSLAAAPDESFYGWGELFDAFQHTRGKVKSRTRDAIAQLQGRGESYSAVPFFLSTRGYGFLLLNSHAAHWEIKAGRLVLEAEGPNAEYILIHGPSFKQILSTYTSLTGRPPLLPRWAFGLWFTSYPQDHQDTVLALVEQHRWRRIPLDAVILDYHWEEGFHNFRWRKSLFPKPEEMMAGLNAAGVRLGLITTPFVNARNLPFQKWLLRKLTHSPLPEQAGDDERALPEYQQGLAGGFFAHPQARWWFGAGGMVDFTHPAASDWWNGMARPLYRQGIAFFKNDDGEYLPDGGRSANGMQGDEYHNIYGFYYGKAMYEGMHPHVLAGEATGRKARGLIYARSVWTGSQRYPAVFLGDQKPTFDHIRAGLRAGLNMGLAGFAYWSADVFGLDGKTSPEVHMRYAQWALLNPVARYFLRPPEIDATRFPWSHGTEVEANFRKYTELRYRLLPYYYWLAWEAYRTGIPIVRPMLLEFPDDPRFAGCADQYMLGDRLLVAPVVTAGAVQRKIVLPAGPWHDFWSGQTWQGPAEIEYPAALDCLPIFVRGGRILPLGPVVQHIPDAHRFEEMELHLYPPLPAECLLYDDDGVTTAYQDGDYALVRVRAEGTRTRQEVRSAPVAGKMAWQPRFSPILHGS